jgi:hypothetical protein
MITEAESLRLILEVAPGFEPHWRDHRASWADETLPYGLDVAAFARYVIDRIQCGGLGKVAEIFALAERLLLEGEETVRDAIATEFLENLMNRVPDDLSPTSFVPHLGPASRAYCRAWDEFTGHKTEGL